jgi:riboflavin kinase/FMN adenylyltransferase
VTPELPAPRPSDAASALPPDVTGTFVTVGTFDGVHRGHQDVLGRLVRGARERGLRSLLVTFEPHPLEVVRPQAAPALLTLPDEKREILAEVGLDYVAVVPFTPTLASYDAEQFVRIVLRERFRMRALLIGYDHGFGRNRSGSAEVLQAIGARDGFGVEVVRPVSAGDERPVSSTMVRQAIAAGDLAAAARGLGRLYSVSGRVVAGDGRGRQLGYRTLNLAPVSSRKLLPPEGVYAVRAQTPLGVFGGMLNLGPRPTFGDARVGIEAHLFDAAGDWYGAHVRLEFVARLRETRRFPDAEALRRQLVADELAARSALTLATDAGNLYSSPIYDPS